MTLLNNSLLKPVIKKTLHHSIIEQLQKKILSGEISPGTKLPTERELAVELNVNRATVREALKKLELLGLISINHGDGIYAQDYLESGNLELLKNLIYLDNRISPGLMESLLEIRRVMVPEMTAVAAVKRSNEDMEKLRELLESDDPVIEKDLKLHKIIARSSRNTPYIFFLNFFNQVFRDFGGIYFSDESNVKRSLRFHEDIYKAMQEQNPDAAHKIMSEILIFAERRIEEAYHKLQKEAR